MGNNTFVTPVVIRKALSSDLAGIAYCHKRSFPDSFYSLLGMKYLEGMYSWYLAYPYTFLLCAEKENKIVGFVGGLLKGGSASVGSASGMTQHTFWLGVRSILSRPWLLLHPKFIPRYKFVFKNILMRITRRFRPAMSRNTLGIKPHAGLVSIAVDPQFHGKGYGHALLKEFESVCAALGYDFLQLSVHNENRSAIVAYERSGWTITGHQEDGTLVMSKSLEI